MQFPAKLAEQYIEVTASREIQQGDLGRILEVNPGGGIVVLTLPPLFGRGFYTHVRQIGEGTVLFVPGTGATLQGVSGLAFRGMATLDKRTATDWYVDAALASVPVETVFEIDWTAEPPQDFRTGNTEPADQWVVGDGVPFYTRMSDGCSQFEIVEGVGLAIQTATAVARTFTGSDAAANDAPAFYFEIADFLTGSFNKPWQLWFHQVAVGCGANMRIFAGIWAPDEGTNTDVIDGGGWVDNFSLRNLAVRNTLVSSDSLNPLGEVLAVCYSQNNIEIFSGAWADGWPELEDMACSGRITVLDGTEVSATAIVKRATSRLALALNCTTGADSNVTIAHQKMVVGP